MIIISNMDKKPASCLDCSLKEHGNCLLQKDSERTETFEEQYRSCPLKEVCTAEEMGEKDGKHCKELERDTSAGFYCGHGKERRKNK